MQSNSIKGKETDITGALVLVFVVLVGVLIAKVSMDFTNQKTSTATKAAPKKATAKQDAWCRMNSPLNGDFNRKKSPQYNASKDFCAGPMTICGDLKDTKVARDATDTYLTTSNNDKNKCGYGLDKALFQCCRDGVAINALGDNLCRNEFSNSDAICYTGSSAKKTCSNSFGASAETNVKCAKPGFDAIGNNKLNEGFCCNVPLSTSETNCGRRHLDCTKFNSTRATDNDLLKNTDKSGVVKPVQCVVQADGMDALCVNQATHVVNGNIRCDGSQFADKVYGQAGCFMTQKDGMPAYTKDPTQFYCAFYPVSLTASEKCKDKVARY